MGETTTQPRRLLVEQARAVREAFRAVERRFQDSKSPAAADVRRWRDAGASAAQALEKAVETFEAPPGARKRLFLISRCLGRLASCGLLLVEEAERFGVPQTSRFEEMAHEARRSAEELAAAAERLGEKLAAQGVSHVVAATRAAGRAEHLRRAATRSLGEEPNAVLAVKLAGLDKRFSEAASHAAEAAELLGEALSA